MNRAYVHTLPPRCSCTHLRPQSLRAAAHGLRSPRERKGSKVERWEPLARSVLVLKALLPLVLVGVTLLWFGVSLWTWWMDGTIYVSCYKGWCTCELHLKRTL